jgi:predicted Zn-dependent protease
MKWAVGEGQKPIYNNRIFSKAFPYFIQFIGETDRREDLERQIDQSLQNALTQWGASLLAVRNQLAAPLKVYVESMLLCDGGRCQYTAPPAVKMKCSQNAAMIIVVYSSRFPAAQEWVAGMAKREGRTILINASEFSLVYDQSLFLTWSTGGKLNLTPVLAHELGHSFGLSHSARPGSIMAADLSAEDVRRFVAPVDGLEFSNVLGKPVEGGTPGDFNLDECQGVYVGRPPSGVPK